jgi:protein-arginine kinase activator protein McsA
VSLQEAIEQEAYEDAAKLRDKIQAIETLENVEVGQS